MPKKLEICAERIIELRKKNHLTQNDLADLCSLSRQQIHQFENKKVFRTDKDLIFRLSNALCCTPDYLQGLVDAPDQIRSGYTIKTEIDNQKQVKIIQVPSDVLKKLCTYFDKNKIDDNDKSKEKTIEVSFEILNLIHKHFPKIEPNNISPTPNQAPLVLSKPFQTGNFRDALIHKIYSLPSSRQSALFTIIDWMKCADDAQIDSFKRIGKEIFSYTPKYEKKILSVQDYIFCRIRDEILPNIEEEAYKFVFSEYASELESSKMEDSKFNAAISQNLGDFQKETKQKLQLKIKNAVIPNKHLSSHDHYYTMERVRETIDYILKCLMISINKELISSDLDQYLPHTKTPAERADLMAKLQKFLSFEVKKYSQPVVKDILTFFKQKQYQEKP